MNNLKEGWNIWPIHFEGEETKHRVVYVENGSIVTDKTFDNVDVANAWIKSRKAS